MENRTDLAKTSNASPALLTLTQSVGVQMLQKRDFNGFASTVPATIEAIAETTPVCVLKHVVSIETMQQLLEAEILKLSARLNVANNMNHLQIQFTAETLLEDFKTCSLEDFIFVFKQMAKGAYGSTYHQLDTSVISLCLQDHLENKSYYQERNNTMSESNEKLPDVDYEAFKNRRKMELVRNENERVDQLKAEREKQMKDLEYDNQKQGYRNKMTLEQFQLRERIKRARVEFYGPEHRDTSKWDFFDVEGESIYCASEKDAKEIYLKAAI